MVLPQRGLAAAFFRVDGRRPRPLRARPPPPPGPRRARLPSARPCASRPDPVLDGDVSAIPPWQWRRSRRSSGRSGPDEGQPASERTRVRVIFTGTCSTSGSSVTTATVGHHRVGYATDAPLEETDSFQVIIDTYRDQLNGFVSHEPAGIEYDGQVTNEGRGGADSTPRRCSRRSGQRFNVNLGRRLGRARADHRHPAGRRSSRSRSGRCASRRGPTRFWGVNFQRNIRRRNERAFWAPIPRQYTLYRLSLAGTVSGIRRRRCATSRSPRMRSPTRWSPARRRRGGRARRRSAWT